MKSIFLTILIFIGVFAFAGSDIFSVISYDWFHYLSYILFASVMLCGIYVTLIRKPNADTSKASEPPLEIEQKKGEYDEK